MTVGAAFWLPVCSRSSTTCGVAELAAVTDQREEACHLELRRDGDVFLSDRQLDRVTGFPELVDLVRVRRLAPLWGREDSLRSPGRCRHP